MTTLAARESVARRSANDLIDELSISGCPIDPEDIARRKAVSVDNTGDLPPSVYGALFRKGNDFGILVSTKCPNEGHRRFTLAHELAHYHIEGYVERLFVGGDGVVQSLGGHFRGRKDPIEVEADAFASELLLPYRFAGPFVRTAGKGVAAVRATADHFRTSLSCAAVRLASLTSDPVMVILSRGGLVEWTTMSPTLVGYKFARVSLKNEWAPRGSGTRRLAAAAHRIKLGESDTETMQLCKWFARAPANVQVDEEAIGLGSFGRVLTVLTAKDLPDPDELEEEEERAAHRRYERRDWRDGLRPYRWDDA